VQETVLIVDDHATFRRFARRLLEESGYEVVGEADSVAAAVEATVRLRPAVVLLDILLPDGSGLDAVSRLSPTAMVVLTSSRSADAFGVALDDVPARGFIPKSAFSAHRFSALIETS
jgi:DNA-binding NarL/FixJ family response regulator